MPAVYEPLPHPPHEHRDYPLMVVPGVHENGVMIYPGVTVHSQEEHDKWLADKEARKLADQEKQKADDKRSALLSDRPEPKA